MKLLIETNTEWLFKKRKRRKMDASQLNEDEDEKICGKVGVHRNLADLLNFQESFEWNI